MTRFPQITLNMLNTIKLDSMKVNFLSNRDFIYW